MNCCCFLFVFVFGKAMVLCVYLCVMEEEFFDTQPLLLKWVTLALTVLGWIH